VDVVLIPEVTFKLEGPTGLLAYLEKVLENKGHAVVCLAEGAGQVGERAGRGGRAGVKGRGAWRCLSMRHQRARPPGRLCGF
jgi:6-phosphofructokinase 1